MASKEKGQLRAKPVATALVGRDIELALLVGRVDDLISGTGRAVLIEGEPGIGKSSLARARP
jgi:predicted ATPase